MMNLAPGCRRALIPLALILIVLSLCMPGQPAVAFDEFPQENAWTRSTPSVVWCGDPASTTTLEVHIVGRSDVARVWLTDLGTSEPEGRAELFDDGSHGDAQSGDGVFTLAGTALPCSPDYLLQRGGYGNWWGFLRVELNSGLQMGHDYGMVVGQVHPDFKNTFSVLDFGGGLSASAYAFFIQDGSHEVMDGYPVTSVYCGTGNFVAYRKLYSVLPDAFDFALVMPGLQIFRPGDLAENVPYDVLVSNAVAHIGIPAMDNAAEFGSGGRLKSVVYHSFGSVAILDHEIAHTWGAAIGQSLGLLHEADPVRQGHWQEMADIQGQLGAYFFDSNGAVGHFAYNGDETWHLIANSEIEPYSPLELYVMGLIPPEQVPPIHILQSPDTADTNRITAASYRTVTIDDILQAEGGPRRPDSTSAQKDFTLAFIVAQDLPYDDAAYAYFSLISYQLMTQGPPLEYSSFAPFYWATGGRATLTSRLPVDLPEPEDLPGTEVPTEAVPTPGQVAAPTAASGPVSSPICGSLFLAGGLVFLPGAWLALHRKRKR